MLASTYRVLRRGQEALPAVPSEVEAIGVPDVALPARSDHGVCVS